MLFLQQPVDYSLLTINLLSAMQLGKKVAGKCFQGEKLKNRL